METERKRRREEKKRGTAELLDMTQALKLGCVDQRKQADGQRHAPVDRILDRLAPPGALPRALDVCGGSPLEFCHVSRCTCICIAKHARRPCGVCFLWRVVPPFIVPRPVGTKEGGTSRACHWSATHNTVHTQRRHSFCSAAKKDRIFFRKNGSATSRHGRHMGWR